MVEGKYDNLQVNEKTTNAMMQKVAGCHNHRQDMATTWNQWRTGEGNSDHLKEWHYGLKEGYVKSADVYNPIGMFNMPDEETVPKHGRAKSQPDECGPARREHAKKKKHEEYAHLNSDEIQEKVDEIFDSSFDGRLDRAGLEKLLEVLGCGEKVEDTEVDWVLAMTDQDHDQKVGRVDLKEIKVALMQYLNARKQVKEKWKKYAHKGEEVLDREEVRKLLTDLNDGVRVEDAELDWVLCNTAKFKHDVLAKPELERAISFWYNHAEAPEKHAPTQKAVNKGATFAQHCGSRAYPDIARSFPR